MIAASATVPPSLIGSFVFRGESPRELLVALTIAFAIGPTSTAPAGDTKETKPLPRAAERRIVDAHVRWAVNEYVQRLTADGNLLEHVLIAIKTAVRRARPSAPRAARDVRALEAWVIACGTAEYARVAPTNRERLARQPAA